MTQQERQDNPLTAEGLAEIASIQREWMHLAERIGDVVTGNPSIDAQCKKMARHILAVEWAGLEQSIGKAALGAARRVGPAPSIAGPYDVEDMSRRVRDALHSSNNTEALRNSLRAAGVDAHSHPLGVSTCGRAITSGGQCWRWHDNPKPSHTDMAIWIARRTLGVQDD